MKTIKTFALALSLSFGFAAAAHAGEGRGQVQVPASAAKAVVAGPIAIAAYSEFSGAKLFVVDAVTGTDKDCQAAARLWDAAAPATGKIQKASLGSALAGDKVETLSVGAGQIACVASVSDRNIELLWKSKGAPAATMLARR
jgi:hypothetical protein